MSELDDDVNSLDSDSESDMSSDGEDNAFSEFDAKAQARRQLVGVVEVAIDGKTQRVCFPMPLQACMLTDKTKQTFLNNARLFTTDKRLELLFGSTDLFIAEMNWVHILAQYSPTYRVIGRHLNNLKMLMYALVILLNINVLMSPPSLSKPIDALFSSKYDDLKSHERASLNLTFGLGALNFIGYFGKFQGLTFFWSSQSHLFFSPWAVIMGYVAATTVPIMIRETDKNIARDRKSLEPSDWTNLGAFKWWFVTLIFNVMFILMHSVSRDAWRLNDPSPTHSNTADEQKNFPRCVSQSTGLYSFLIFGINLTWTLRKSTELKSLVCTSRDLRSAVSLSLFDPPQRIAEQRSNRGSQE
jgi:hypothetical protein